MKFTHTHVHNVFLFVKILWKSIFFILVNVSATVNSKGQIRTKFKEDSISIASCQSKQC